MAVLTALEKQLSSVYGTLSLSTPPGLLDLRPFSWAGWRVTPEYAFALPLSGDSPSPPSLPPARLDANILPPDDLLARLVAERRYGTVCQIRPRGGLSFPVLVVGGASVAAPLPIGPLPEGCSAKDVIHTAVAVGREGSDRGGTTVFLVGEEWTERLGDGDVDPLIPVVTGRLEKGRGGGR